MTHHRAASTPGTRTASYQVMPALSAEEYAALKVDIAAHGVRVPIDVDEAGDVLDGHHRQRIAAELGMECPSRTVSGMSEQQKREHALTVNLARRHLSTQQRRQLIAREIGRAPQRSDRDLARLVGCDHKTVGAVRRKWSTGEVPHRDPESREPASGQCSGCVICTRPDIICHYLPVRRYWQNGLVRLVYIDGHGVVYDRYGSADELDTDSWEQEKLPNDKTVYVCRRPLTDCGDARCPVCTTRYV